MREIKFRAWDKEKKVMIFSTDISHFDLSGTERKLYYYYPEQVGEDEWEQAQGIEYLKKIVLMQHTGLKDKNGKEIYEGDIVRFKLFKNEKWTQESTQSHGYLEVGFDDEILQFCLMEYSPEFKEYVSYDLWRRQDLEVIGNIYENKELLNENN